MSSTPTSISSPLPEAAASVGLGYGIAIAVGILVLISTIMLASYVCVRVKGGSRPSLPDSSTAAPPSSDSPLSVPGLNRPMIDSYPKFSFSSGAVAGDSSCPICLSDYRPGDPIRLIPDCKHCFHATCIDEWLAMSATCPLCRTSPAPTPVATPLSELIPLAVHARSSCMVGRTLAGYVPNHQMDDKTKA